MIALIAAPAMPQGVARITYPNGGETFRPGSTQNLTWDTTGVPFSQRWNFQFGTSPVGPWTNIANAVDIKDSGSTRGRHTWRVPSAGTSTGYIRMIATNNPNSWDINNAPFIIEDPQEIDVDSTLRGEITGTVRLNRKKVYGIDGYVYVSGTLIVEPGTIIVGDTVGQNSVISVNRGGMIVANGTKENPIVFTSRAAPGQRSRGDWGGIVICGRARINVPAGEAPIEGGIADPNPGKGWYGGTDDDDSSGVLRYVRIEFAGIAVLPNNELNGLTMGGVGRRTVLDYIQVSHSNDDAFEWFGGSVNAKHLIAFGTLDDDFDCDFGFKGKVQFGLVKRFRQIADVSTSQAFECDNDGSSSYNKPFTSATFSNITAIGPVRDTSWTSGTGNNEYSSRFGAGAQIRRNARVSIFNSIFLGWPRGIEIAQSSTMFAALTDSLAVRASNWFGVKGTWLNLAGGTAPPGMDANWIDSPNFGNGLDASNPNNAQLTNPWPEDGAFDPLPYPSAPYLNTALFNIGSSLYPISDAFFTQVDYRGAFGTDGQTRWDAGWANYDPVNTEYKASVNVIVRSPGASAGESYVRGTKVNILWDTTGTQNENFKIEYGASITGPWTTVVASVTDAGVNRGVYEWTLPSTVMPSVYVRLSAVSDQTSFDVSDFPFEIEDVPQPFVRVMAPGAANGEVYRVGQTVAIRWDTTNTLSQRWKIEFGKSKIGPWRTILANVKDSASTRGSALVVFRREDETTTGYVRLVLLSDTSRTDVNDNPFTVSAPTPVQCDSVLKGEITGRVHLSNQKVYCLDGYVFVNDGAVLEIEPGTIVLGDTVGQNSVLAINRGGKILARGTPQKPIIFSSSARPGERSRGDWGGIVICGKASINPPAGEAPIEGGIADPSPGKGWYGGTDDDDSSGVIEYARIEFAGIAVIPNAELNGLTMGGVGRRTIINNIQVSHGNDDAFEWFGGTVNHKNLIALGTLDDDFDSDFGYRGKIQFAVAQRFRSVADASTSQTFEQDNDGSSSANQPFTAPVFSNITSIGPIQDTSWTTGSGNSQYNSRYGAAAQIRRNARTSIHNSVFIGWPRGIEIAQSATMDAANNNELEVRNDSWYGIKGSWMNLASGTPPSGMDANWIAQSSFNNIIDKSSPNVAMLENPFVTDVNFNPVPKVGSPLLTASTGFGGTASDPFFENVSYRGAFGMQRWDLPWANYDPVNAEYKPQDTTTGVDEEKAGRGYIISGSAQPNPTQDVALIRYELGSADNITIKVFDVTGSIASTFIANEEQGVGIYEFNLVTNGLGNGLYYVAITGRKGSITIPVTVAR
jgi:hypothetical protein